MPEGPECRRNAEGLARRVSGQVLESITIETGRYTKKPPSGLDGVIANLPAEVVGAGVHGKFIYWILKNDLFIWSTLGMTGQWSTERSKHTRLSFDLGNGSVFYNDQRNFGTIKFVQGKFRLIEKLKSFGPDMLAEDVLDEVFIECLRKKPKWQITRALMDQEIIAGVGNYIKSDALWLARISPRRSVGSLSDDELSNINRAIKQVMHESYQNGSQYSDGFTKSGDDYEHKHLVYNQLTDPDGNEVIREMTADKRTTYWVPKVQI